MSNQINRYSDIIDLPHHRSMRRPQMSVYNRAAQFAPFAALIGYDDMVQDVAGYHILEQRIILSEDEKNILDRQLRRVLDNIKHMPEIAIIYFDEMEKQQKGRYNMYSGKVRKIEEYPKRIVFEDGHSILIGDIVQIDIGKTEG